MPQWKFDNSLSWGDVIMTGGLLMTGLLAFTDLSSRVDVHDERIGAIGRGTSELHGELQSHVERESNEREALRNELRSDLHQISLKLDKLIEREISRPTR